MASTPACVCVSTSSRPRPWSVTARAIVHVLPQPAGAIIAPRQLRAKSATMSGAMRPSLELLDLQPEILAFQRLPVIYHYPASSSAKSTRLNHPSRLPAGLCFLAAIAMA